MMLEPLGDDELIVVLRLQSPMGEVDYSTVRDVIELMTTLTGVKTGWGWMAKQAPAHRVLALIESIEDS